MQTYELGRVVLVQVAPVAPKIPGPTHELYDPSCLVHVSRLQLTERGVAGISSDGTCILDVHHADHPASRFRGENAISIGFTSHYAQLRQQFGPHVVDGCAAENILVDAGEIVALDAPRVWVLVEHAATGERHMLNQAIVAEPCMPFARWVAGPGSSPPPDQVRTILQQLRRGMRGFYLGLAAGTASTTIQLGDRILIQTEG